MDVTPIWRSPAMLTLLEEAGYAARSEAKVLLTGESGVGKELVARLIHDQSPRRSSRFVAINCAGIPDSLLESELFGHERGSFTGAHRDKEGLLEVAHTGTVFLDEVGEMSPRMQGLLLRFLETGELQRVGGQAADQRVDVRLISATNRELADRVAQGAFRQDLFYRLNVLHLVIPPLRDRREAILPLLEHFLATFAQRSGSAVPALDERVRRLLVEYHWPGNVRELRNVAERIAVRGGAVLAPEDLLLASPFRRAPAESPATRPVAERLFEQIVLGNRSFWEVAYQAFVSRDMTRDDLRELIKRGLEQTGGDAQGLVDLFNMRPSDSKRFVYFLRKHDCDVGALRRGRSLKAERRPHVVGRPFSLSRLTA
jgi:transcriptional regulator with PAS, ATPase and Fis domain